MLPSKHISPEIIEILVEIQENVFQCINQSCVHEEVKVLS